MSTDPIDGRTPAGLTAAIVGASFAVTAAVVAFLAGPLALKVLVAPVGIVFALMLILSSLRLVALPAYRRK